ncbi:hypothetical protein DFH11DRAFT_463468 [Phellopilus nigrolimitatus]|nr:hypothetical protein DFH11DRAFT_463468 [Phellopilus nigrolimitatus]
MDKNVDASQPAVLARVDICEGETFAVELRRSHSSYTVMSTSSFQTRSDMPGPGRILDKLFSSWGKSLEARLNRFAETKGLGPRHVSKRIESNIASTWAYSLLSGPCTKSCRPHIVHDGFSEPDVREIVQKDCAKLLKYMQSNVVATQLETLTCIIILSTAHPLLQLFFRNLSTETILRNFIVRLKSSSYVSASSSEFDDLLLAARRALICVEHNEISELARGMYRSSRVRISLSEKREKDSHICVAELLAYTRDHDTDFAFITTAYLDNWLRFIGDQRYNPSSPLDELVRHGALFHALATLVQTALSIVNTHMLDCICSELLEQFKYTEALHVLKLTTKNALVGLVSSLRTTEAQSILPSASRVAEVIHSRTFPRLKRTQSQRCLPFRLGFSQQ